jgi:PHD/YefM family antitoxin component YafN of YafNO toxin-antitoxin module
MAYAVYACPMTTAKISAFQSRLAREKFRDLLNMVEIKGENVAITRYDKVCAVMVSATWYETAEALMAQQENAA